MASASGRSRRRVRSGGHPGLTADGWMTKVLLAAKINELLDRRELNQNDAAEQTGMSQSKISAIRHHKLNGISLERLLQVLIRLDQQVEIVVKPAGTTRRRSIEVVT